ncbi:terminase large subunit domain-containing protein [Roseibium alexandrii]
MAATIEVEIQPRRQFREFLTTTSRYAIIVAHRRAGKTVACIQRLVKAALENTKRKPRYAYIAPLLKQAKTVAWDYLKEYALKIPGATVHESELRADFPNGAQIRLYGSDNPDSLRGIYLDGVVLDEAADMSPRVYSEILRPALSDRKGWSIWIGTPKGQNEFYDLWQNTEGDEDWYRLRLKASETGLIDDDELRQAKRQMTLEQYEQEYETSFHAAIMGAYYSRDIQAAEDAGRMIKGLYDPGMEVHTAWDLGVGDDTSIIFFQQVNMEIRIVDFYATNGYGLDHYAKVLREKGYIYGKHYLPHDVGIRVLSGGDIAKTRKQTLEGLGIPVTEVPKWSLEDGINAVRRVLPRVWFDPDTSEYLLKSLRQYRRHYDENRKVFMERPLHDWASHAADAMRYLAIAVEDPTSGANHFPQPDAKWVF